MTEAFDPNALVGTQDLLAIVPDTIRQQHDPEIAAVGFIGLARGIMNRRPWEEQVPLGEVRDDPTNQWGLTLEEKGLANRAAETHIAENNFTAEIEAIAADTLDSPAQQAEAVRNATLMLHHAARNTILLPRRQVYQEFAEKRRYWLTRLLGLTGLSQLVQGGNPQVRISGHMYAEAAIRGTRPTAELPDFNALEPTAAKSIMQKIIGDAAVLARLLLRHDPERLTNQNVWPSGPAALAQSALRRDPLDLRQALLDAPDTPAGEIIADYLRDPSHLDDFVTTVAGKRAAYTIPDSRERDQRTVRTKQQLLEELLDRDDVRPELPTAATGAVIHLTSENEPLSQGRLSLILNANLDALTYSQWLDAVAKREVERTGMPELSKTWQNDRGNPIQRLLGDYYGRVSNLRIVKIPVDESVLRERGETAEQIDLRRLVRMHVTVDLRSSAGGPIKRTVEVLIYPRRKEQGGYSRDLISVKTNELADREASGANAVIRLWEASAARARAIAEAAPDNNWQAFDEDYS